ncbi:SIR2 family protein [Liberiplasma polymorphum]|uniref:SIR2 family protein n=1 Tax=Liberiplasma polymorphum TaxID=3374570 RepID=UPI003772C7DF
MNGKAVKQMGGLVRTNEKMKKHLGKAVKNFENDLLCLTKHKKDLVLKEFTKELGKSIENVDWNHKDILDISVMFGTINQLVMSSENRTRTMKQVNIYTTNYDDVIEKILIKSGNLCNVVSSSNIDSNDKFFDMIGYDYAKETFLPTYLVSKIHGDLLNPILPSKNKYDETLQKKRFEILFRMKSQLSRENSVLFIIGYSGNDEHLNSIISDAIGYGLTAYWFKFDNDDKVPEKLDGKVHIIEQPDNSNKVNSTFICSERIRELWDNQSVE